MKKKLGFTFSAVALSAIMCFGVACGNKPVDPVDPVDPEPKTYTVTFKDGDTVLEDKTITVKDGDKITLPAALTTEDARYTFAGWNGYAAGSEITIFDNMVFNAQWTEMFGSATTFGITQKNVSKAITVDGVSGADEAWTEAEELNLDENGSTLKLLWDTDALYLFANVVKADGAANDKLIVTLDLLHSDKLANESWDGLGWGDKYRGEPGPMVEGGYTIGLGENGDTTVEKSWEWLSNGGYGSSAAKYVAGDNGYTVEFKIDLTDGSIGEYKPAVDQEIGLAVRTTDGASALESFKGYGDHGPKSLSNMKLMLNEKNANVLWNVKEVRELYDVTVDGQADEVYKDAGLGFDVEGNNVKALWKNGKVYLLATLAEGTTSLKVAAFGETVTFTKSGEKELAANGIALDAASELTVEVNGQVVIGAADNTGVISLKANDNNFGRHLYEVKQLAAGAEIKVDGDLDEAYGDKVADVNVVFQNNPTATGEVYIRWDNEHLYVFVEVTDASVCTTSHSDPYMDDSVEVTLDTCQTNTFDSPITTGWGGDHRPNGDYCGEGHFRMNPWGAYSNQHWMADWAYGTFDGVECTSIEDAIEKAAFEGGSHGYCNRDGKDWYLQGTAAKMTDNGYNVEFRINWMSFGDTYKTAEEKIGQVIGFMVNINDANNHTGGDRNGVMSLNSKGGDSWQWTGVLDQLKLVKA